MGVLVFVLPVVLYASAFANIIQDEIKCGIENIPPGALVRAVGGHKTAYGEFPWMAALHYIHADTGRDVGIVCSGFVINNRFVVTAANCLHLDYLDLDEVWLGVRRITKVATDDANKVRKFFIDQKIPHGSYNPITSENDIALLKLKDAITYSDYIRPLCLPNADSALPPGGTMLTVAGWGEIRSGGPASDYKLAVDVPMYAHEDCEDHVGYPITSNQLCAEGEELKGTCWGDAGGPLMQSLPSGIGRKWYAVGLVSSIIGCGKHGDAVVHTRVSSYVSWIEQTVANS